VTIGAGQIATAGQGFVGSNLGMMFSNAGTRTTVQATLPGSPLKVENIDVMGGWGEITFKPSGSKFLVNGGAGLEILDDEQTDSVVTASAAQMSQNLTVFGNLQVDPLPKVTMAFEVGYIKSTYKYLVVGKIEESDGTNLNAAFSARFSF